MRRILGDTRLRVFGVCVFVTAALAATYLIERQNQETSSPRQLSTLGTGRLCVTLGSEALSMNKVVLAVANPTTDQPLFKFDELDSDGTGKVSLNTYDQEILESFGFTAVNVTIEIPGYIASKSTNVPVDGSSCGNHTAQALRGDINSDNLIDLTDIVGFIRALNTPSPGDTPTQRFRYIYNNDPQLSQLATMIHHYNDHVTGAAKYSLPPRIDLTSFESSTERTAVTDDSRADAVFATTYASTGSQAITATFSTMSATQYGNVYVAVPITQKYWRGYRGISVVLSNPGNSILSFGMAVLDSQNHSYAARFSLEPGVSKQKFIVTFSTNLSTAFAMSSAPGFEGRNYAPFSNGTVDLSDMAKVQFYMNDLAAPAVVGIDDVKLERGGSFNKIVDAYGQYTRKDWTGKITQDADLVAADTAEQQDLANHPALTGRDIYGGTTQYGTPGTATGYFHVQKINGKWTFVDPLGNPYYATGIGTMRLGAWSTTVTNREFMFQSLPPQTGDSLSQFYATNASDKIYSFYNANLYKKYRSDYAADWATRGTDRLKSWGFTSVGINSDYTTLSGKGVPYVVSPIWSTVTGQFKTIPNPSGSSGPLVPDPYDPAWTTFMTGKMDALITPTLQNDPYLLGYFIDNEFGWGSGTGSGASRYAPAIGTLSLTTASSPAKQEFIDQLMATYSNDISLLNAAWGTSFVSWATLIASYTAPTTISGAMATDFSAFQLALAREHFSIVDGLITARDANHMYLCEKFSSGAPAEVIQAASEYCDVVSYDVYRFSLDSFVDSLFNQFDVPYMIGEYNFSGSDHGYFGSGLVSVGNEDERAASFKTYFRSALDRPNVVGAFWFGYADESITAQYFSTENFASGFIDITDTPYAAMRAAAREVNAEMYSRRYGP